MLYCNVLRRCRKHHVSTAVFSLSINENFSNFKNLSFIKNECAFVFVRSQFFKFCCINNREFRIVGISTNFSKLIIVWFLLTWSTIQQFCVHAQAVLLPASDITKLHAAVVKGPCGYVHLLLAPGTRAKIQLNTLCARNVS